MSPGHRLRTGLVAVAIAASSCGGGGVAPTGSPAGTTGTGPAGEVVLERGGLGVAIFGDPVEATIAAVSAALGEEPREDTGWLDAFSLLGTCPGTAARGVAWGDLTALFTDGDSGHAEPGTAHFFSYRYRAGSRGPDGLSTPEGIRLGSTVGDLRAAYGDELELPADEPTPGGPRYRVGAATGVTDFYAGTVGGLEDDARVVSIDGGIGCLE